MGAFCEFVVATEAEATKIAKEVNVTAKWPAYATRGLGTVDLLELADVLGIGAELDDVRTIVAARRGAMVSEVPAAMVEASESFRGLRSPDDLLEVLQNVQGLARKARELDLMLLFKEAGL